MASDPPLIDYIRHYQKGIERANNDEKKLLHCFSKLNKLPIRIEHLQNTGIGKTVNNFRKAEGEVGVTAKALVGKWKIMVAEADSQSIAEEETEEANYVPAQNDVSNSEINSINQEHNTKHHSHHHHNQHHEQHKSRHEHKKDESFKYRDKERSQRESHAERAERKERERLEKEKERHKRERHSEKHEEKNVKVKVKEHKKDRNDDQQPTTSNLENNKEINHAKYNQQRTTNSDIIEEKEERRHKDNKHHHHHHHHRHKEHKHDISTNRKDNEHRSSKHEKKSTSGSGSGRAEKRLNNTDIVDEVSKKRAKIAYKTEELADEENDDGIDSSMGANFEDVLGALNMSAGSSRKSKKSTTNSSTNKHNTSSMKSDSASTSKSVPELQKQPILLTSAVKLQPLDPNLALELPTISNNYRPMPLNKVVMDCVFNNSNTSSAPKAPIRTLSDSEALAQGISSKTMRTKIYSGVKSGQIFQVPSLFNMCIRLLQKNLDALEYTGGIPYSVLKPIIERATPEQLYVFEEYNPYILEDSDELWKLHVQRKYRTQKRQEMESWREMFMRCREDEAIRLSRLTESIKQKEKIMAAPIKQTKMAFSDSLAKPPRNIARKQEIFGTRSQLIATPAARVAALSSVAPNAASIGDVRLRVAASTSRDTAQASSSTARPKKAPLMAKTLQFMRGRHKR